MAKVVVNGIVEEELFTLGALGVVFVAAVIANVDIVAVLVYSKGKFIGEKIFVALCAKQIFVSETTRTDIRTVIDKSHPASVEVFLTMLAEAVIFVETTFAHVDTLAVAINDFPSFGTIIFAFLAELATVVIAILAEKFRRNFVGAGNAQPVCSDIENFKVMGVVLPDRNFSVKVRVNPIAIATKATTASDVNVMFVATVFFRLPEVRDAFEFGKFTLNQIAIKFGFSLSPASTAISVVESTLKK